MNTDNNHDNIIRQIKQSFPTVYLTLISIIQTSVLGYLLFIFSTIWNEIKPIGFIVIFATFLIIVLTWFEYLIGSTALRWIPKLRDSFIPFIIGISEISIVHNITSNPNELYFWLYSISFYCFVGFLSYVNMYTHARKHQENNYVLNLLGKYPIITQLWALICIFIFAIFGRISQIFPRILMVQYLLLTLSVILIIAFICRASFYWQIITGNS